MFLGRNGATGERRVWETPRLAAIRDACGVGVVADIEGRRSHRIVRDALQVLANLGHRGARNADPETGDGAGIVIQMPDAFLRRECLRLGIELPRPGAYAAGMAFLPQNDAARRACEDIIRRVAGEEGQLWVGWRDVPVDSSRIGRTARERQPVIRQFFIAAKDPSGDPAAFERKLYLLRKLIERAVAEAGIGSAEDFYIPSLSSNRIVYKGMLLVEQLPGFYPDLTDEQLESGFAIVHSRFSTNTLGSWNLAHPYRHVVHNGEINTLRGNANWMVARQAILKSAELGQDLQRLFPIIPPDASDTACFDAVLELLLHAGRSLPHSLLMMIPEAWQGDAQMPKPQRDFYEYHSCLMEPWDGPALIVATDGVQIAAILDRNGLRPFRYLVTNDGLLVVASEVGVLDIPAERVALKGRLRPGMLFVLDPAKGRIYGDAEVKTELAARRPYGRWLAENQVDLAGLPEPGVVLASDLATLVQRQRAFGYTVEDLNVLIQPMATTGAEPVSSMGTDTPLAVLSEKAPLLFSYFKQLFAQVTNPPLDAIREELVTSLETTIGQELNLLEESPEHCRQLRLAEPVITNRELEQLRALDRPGLKAATLPILCKRSDGVGALGRALEDLLRRAAQAVEQGCTILILSDRGVDADHMPIPSLLATAAVHHHLIREGMRAKAGIVVESGEPREVHHFALLLGYGAGAVNPYLSLESVEALLRDGALNGLDARSALKSYIGSITKGLLKVMSKMGISTLQGYRGAQIFEAIGLSEELVERFFTWTPSRISGVGLAEIEREARERHRQAYPDRTIPGSLQLEMGGQYSWIRDGEHHLYDPESIALLQYAAANNDRTAYAQFAATADREEEQLSTIRGLLGFKTLPEPIPLHEVEPAEAIIKRFGTGAISLGAISKEAHETIAIAMNGIGAKSNTGEGGEDHRRYKPDADGKWRNSAVKQVASGRFGVTANYLVNATDLQIKIAQGSKPGEGGQLPGFKVDEYIGWVRKATPGVELISPPPHHDIYSIEDLAQLIYDLKNVNPQARIHVKLVAEAGVGTVAAGVAKAHGDVVLISGDSGGTGASPLSSIKHAGIPWELGVAEAHRVLVANGLRERICIQTDGQLRTGRDVAIAAMLGAEEFGFSTAPLIVLGCIMLRKCHLNTCSVGIATQDPVLRARFAGRPEALVNYFYMVAEHLREIMAQLGFRKVEEMVGRADRLVVQGAANHWKARGLDLSQIVGLAGDKPGFAAHAREAQDHGLESVLDNRLIELAGPALAERRPVKIELPIRNANRATGAMLSGELARKYGEEGLPDHTIQVRFSGAAGQSFGAFLARGISMTLEGEANDYLAKGLSGGHIVLVPPPNATFAAEANVIAGNVVLYGATGGKLFIRGQAGERFAVRNSGAQAVVEGIGDHGCEYMTAGVVVVIGPTGRNFGAGMSGGMAFVLDRDRSFARRCNTQMVELEQVQDPGDAAILRSLLGEHFALTGSPVAASLLERWESKLAEFVKVMPRDYKRLLAERAARSEEENRVAMELVGNG